jgi:hypothetical protein
MSNGPVPSRAMSTYGPFSTRARLLQRSNRLADLIVRNRPGTTGYRIWVAKTMVDAYGTWATSGLAGSGGTMVLQAGAGRMAQSPTIMRSGRVVEESRRGLTSFQLDLEDHLGADVGPDDHFHFVRVQEQRAGAWLEVPAGAALNPGNAVLGPILVLPTATQSGMAASVVSLYGEAPLATTCLPGDPPILDMALQVPPPLHLVFYAPAGSVTIRNLSNADSLLFSFGLGMTMALAPKTVEVIPTGGGYSRPSVSEVVLAAEATAGSVVPFGIDVMIGREWS